MIEILRYASGNRPLEEKAKRAMRVGVLRVLKDLATSGVVLIRPPRAGGGYALYRWKNHANE